MIRITLLRAGVVCVLCVHLSCTDDSNIVVPLGQPQALPTAAPAIVGSSAVGLSFNSLILTGYVRPNRLQTICYFEYGNTPNFGQRTGDLSISSDTGTVIVRDTLANLPAGTLFHYRLVASNAKGTVGGPDSTATTFVEFVFPLTLGTHWRYKYFFRFEDPPFGDVETTNGSQLWQVTSTGVGVVPYDAVVSVTRIDTFRQTVKNSMGSSDTTYVTQSQTSFTVSVTAESVTVRWPQLMWLASGDTLLGRISRSAPPEDDALVTWARGGYGSASYAQNTGLVNWSAAIYSNHTWNESLTLVSYTR